jgi:hypoxanthine phosphoribosyltransferase
LKVAFSRQRLESRVAQLAQAISKDYAGRTLDVVVILENAFLFGADLIRRISNPVVCHFVRSEMRDVRMGGYDRREIFFTQPPRLAGRDVLLVDAVLHTGVTQDFLIKRLEESRPRSLRLAVLFDKPQERKVDLQAEYTGFAAASKHWVGYGLAGRKGLYRNLPYVGMASPDSRLAHGARAGRRRRRPPAKGSRG